MHDLKKLILRAKEGDKDAVCELMEIFENMINRYSYVSGTFDEDLHSELTVSMIKCIKKFKVDESAFFKCYEEKKLKGNNKRIPYK